MHLISRSLLVVAAVVTTTSQAFSQVEYPSSPAGVEAFPTESARSVILPSLGTGVSAASTGATMQPDSPPAGGLKTAAYGVGGPVGPESIINWDSRTRAYTTLYPNRAIVLIKRNGLLHCTGWMISSNTLATAGHCVHTGGSTGSWYPRTSFTVHPGGDGASSPYGSCTVRRLHSNTGWTVDGNAQSDYGAMRLNCTVGTTVGWFGMYHMTSFLNQAAIIGGYPGDKPSTQWTSADKIRGQDSFMLGYRMDTVGGMSGSPVWHDRTNATSTTGAWAFAIHAYGTGLNRFSNMNSAPRLYASRINLYVNWINQP